MTIEVREARPDEHAEAGEVTALAYREFVRPGDPDWEDYLRRIADVESRAQVAVVLVATEGESILGSATLELEERIESDDRPLPPGEAQIRMLGVHPDARRRGVARMLIDACFERARAVGKTRMTLHTTHRMKVAQAMYEGMGFRRLPDRVFPDGFVLLTYERGIG
ncbi:MAG TPA: GNAT family N-acetyltransferase [Actinomycetota bacterium]|nr:GNAT family N-acetyltransferase [Actinomycetota bacterium]